MRRNSYKEKSKSEHKVVKKCTECEKEIPVACKTCPLCKSPVVLSKAQKPYKPDEEREGSETVAIRRTERIRRERPDFFNSLEVDNKFKKKRRRKESVETKGSEEGTTDRVSLSEDGEVPKRRRGRPKSVSTVDLTEMIETKSPPPEEDWYAHLPPEKFQQYQIILAEINRKFTSQNFKPV